MGTSVAWKKMYMEKTAIVLKPLKFRKKKGTWLKYLRVDASH